MVSFRDNVFSVVRTIPRGKVLTYGEVARRAGRPRAYRAVGNILRSNFDPAIPCHRVVRSDGTLGGYNRGAAQKKKRLRKEGYTACLVLGLFFVGTFHAAAVTTGAFDSRAVTQDDSIFMMPIILFFVLFYLYYVRGRDPQLLKKSNFDGHLPLHLTPIELGTVLDETVNKRDIVATIFDLARRGHIIIRASRGEKDDFELEKKQTTNPLKNALEAHLMTILFGFKSTSAQVSRLAERLHEEMPSLREHTYGLLVSKKYFPRDPHAIRIAYGCTGGFIALLGFFFANTMFYWTVSFALSGVLLMVFGMIMPSRTKKGVALRTYGLHMRHYMRAFPTSRKPSQEQFEILFPYAIALGTEEAWAQEHKDITFTKASWLVDHTVTNWNAQAYADIARRFQENIHYSLFATLIDEN